MDTLTTQLYQAAYFAIVALALLLSGATLVFTALDFREKQV